MSTPSENNAHPYLLSPDHANRPLEPEQDPIIVYPSGGPVSNAGYTPGPGPLPVLPHYVDSLPAGFVPTSAPVIPSPHMLGLSHDLPSGSTSRSSSFYEVAPVPDGVVYPEPPGKSPIPLGFRLSNSTESTNSSGRPGKLSPLGLGFNSLRRPIGE